MGASRGFFRLALAATICTLATAAAVPNAEANYRRQDCFSGAGAMGRNMGVRNSTRLFAAVWARLGRNCANIDRLVNVIADTPLAPPSSRGIFQACFYQGYTENLFQQLDDASTRCADRCFNAGSEIGRISAEGYCAASAAVGGLDDPGFIQQPALPLCGYNVVMGCKSEYIQYATVENPSCAAFTDGSFYQTFDNIVRQDCYVPQDVPVRDQFAGDFFGGDSYQF